MKNDMKRNRLEKLFLHMIQATGSHNGSAPDVAGETKQELKQDRKETRHESTALFQRFYRLAQSVLAAIWSKSLVGLHYYILMQI